MRQIPLLIAVLFLSLPLGAETLRIDQAGVSVEIASGWDLQDDREGMFTLTSPDERASVVFEAVEAEEDDVLEAALTDYLLEFVDEAYYTEPWIEQRIGGLFYLEAVGVAVVGDAPVSFRVGYYRLDREVGLIVLSAVEEGWEDIHGEAVLALIESVARLPSSR